MLTGAVFLSYASADAAAAERICTSLRDGGVEVWFDQSELRGGDAWDQSIRKQIKTCAPERFREVQWTRLPDGDTPAAFVERVRRLLPGEPTISLDPDLVRAYEHSGLSDYQLGNLAGARATCEARPNYWGTQWCLALTYERLGRHADAQAAVAKIQAMQGDTTAYQYATIYAQWGDTAKALEWLESAMRLRDPGLSLLKSDPLMDPLRNQPRFQAIERELKFPD